MPISEQSLETLEFPKIRQQLAQHTAFSASRELALNLWPAVEEEEIVRRLRLTSEARRLLDEHADVTIGGARDIREAARHAARGGILEASSLLEVAGTLRSMRHMRSLLLKLDAAEFPHLVNLAPDLPQLPTLEDQIERTMGDDGQVLDSASAALGRIRRDIRTAASRLQDRMHALVNSGQHADALQEAIVTVRDGRYVVPVKATHRRAIPGLVHDQSASGATLYIEPMAAVELNNQLREAQLAEEQEIKRILAALSAQVGTAADMLVAGVETLALLDLYLAQAKYALALRCIEPGLTRFRQGGWHLPAEENEERAAHGEHAHAATSAPGAVSAPLLLTTARHPLLNQSSVVPIDIWAGEDCRLLLITGPNTGGKTVALKTTGMLVLMAQAGLHIPASDPSRLPVFDQVFADIGDEQSIEQSLSTFSSHMTNIIRILTALEQAERQATRSNPAVPPLSLVLLDELGAGTDPVEGAALARAISGRLLGSRCLAVCTTHYADLKAFAHNMPGVQNASVEFDVETLAPTYRLTIGLPGRSNALAIAERLGLDAALVDEARGMISREEAQIESLLANIHREREAAAAERQRAEELRADAEKYRERYVHTLHELDESLQERVETASQQLEQELREVRAELRRLRDESRSSTLSRKWGEESEQRLQEMRAKMQQTGQHILASTPADKRPGQPAQDAPPRPLCVGDMVQVRSVGLQGEILSIDEEDETAEVQVGGFRMQVDVHELKRDKRGGKNGQPQERQPPPSRQRSVRLPPMPDVSMTFDMRGWRAAEVPERLDHYLNDAYLAGLPQVRLIHGRGSGTLRQVVRDMLQRHPLIESFDGGGADGGEGVTVAKLTER